MKNNHPSHSNKITTVLLRNMATVCAALGLLAGCGQRGSLYLPTVPEAAQRSTIVDTLTKPASDANSAPAK